MNSKIRCSYFLIFLLLFFSSFSQAQDKSKPFISIEGEVLKPLKLTLDDLKTMEAHAVKTKDMQGQEHTFTGVKLVDVLHLAGVTLGKELRGENLTKSLLFTAADGYQVVYALAEIDPEFTDQLVLLAYEVDEKVPFGSLLRITKDLPAGSENW